jgi:hypothetical protein
MTPSCKLSRSAPRNQLYFASFGSAGRDERKNKYCDSPKYILKMRRRELFNSMMKSEEGSELLRASAAKYLPPNKIDTLMADSSFRKIEEKSDEDDDDAWYEKNQFKKTSLHGNKKTTIRNKVVDRVRQWNDEDMFDYDQKYPLETDQQSNTYKSTCQSMDSTPRPTLAEVCRSVDDAHEAEGDSNEYDDEEDICEKDFIRLRALKGYLAPREGSIESDADWFDTYEQGKWPSTAERSDADLDVYDMMDIDNAEADNESPSYDPDDDDA